MKGSQSMQNKLCIYSEEAALGDIIRSKAYLQAYVRKREIKNDIDRKMKAIPPKKIPPLTPIRNKQEGLFDHSQGVVMSNRKLHPPKIMDRWWEKSPSIAGELSLDVHKRLSDVSHYTGLYKERFDNRDGPLGVSGDFIDRPIRAIRLLNSTSASQLTIPGRAADFKSEVEWRLSLRPQFN